MYSTYDKGCATRSLSGGQDLSIQGRPETYPDRPKSHSAVMVAGVGAGAAAAAAAAAAAGAAAGAVDVAVAVAVLVAAVSLRKGILQMGRYH